MEKIQVSIDLDELIALKNVDCLNNWLQKELEQAKQKIRDLEHDKTMPANSLNKDGV